ncbi:MAG TPA: hypothetical protein VHM70_21360 [Polyangiaceae bacterium]|nr:hypothetical protein [Polyangiaceae bacterium]
MKTGLSGVRLWVVTCVGVAACGATSNAQIRSQASREWNCPESQIEVEREGANTLRATGCGKSEIWICDPPRKGAEDMHTGPVTEAEAHYVGNEGSCNPAHAH